MSQQNFVKISSFFSSFSSSSFRTLCKNRHNSCVGASILLKFGTRIGGLKANTSIDFWVNLINIEGVISDFTHKSKLNFCQAYRAFSSRAQACTIIHLAHAYAILLHICESSVAVI